MGLKVKHLVADTANCAGKFLGCLIAANITPHIRSYATGIV